MKLESPGGEKNPSQPTSERQISVRHGEIDSRELFQTAERELLIRHGADTYRLRLTGLNKLILTK
jgi:hemin uptake protein HemP